MASKKIVLSPPHQSYRLDIVRYRGHDVQTGHIQNLPDDPYSLDDLLNKEGGYSQGRFAELELQGFAWRFKWCFEQYFDDGCLEALACHEGLAIPEDLYPRNIVIASDCKVVATKQGSC